MSDPKSDLEKARKIVEKLEKNVLQANWYAALYERIAFNEDIGNAFGISFEAWGLEKCSDALLDSLVVILMRIVQGKEDNTASFQVLMEVVKKPGIFQLLEQENTQYGKKLPCDLEEFQKRVKAIKEDHRYEKIKSYRGAWVAHQAIDLNPKKHKFPKYEDPCQWLDKIRPVVELCWNLLKDPSSDFSDRASLEDNFSSAKKSANEFWEYAAHLRENFSDREDL